MKKIIIYTFTILFFGVLSLTGLNVHAANKKAPTLTENASAQSMSSDQLGKHFREAKNDFLKKDYKKAAFELREAAGLLREKVGQSPGESREALTNTAEKLDLLSDQIEKGAVTSVREIEDAVSQAYNALAESYKTRASESWAQKALSQTGEYLEEAADNYEQAWLWSGRQIDSAAKLAIRSARELRSKIEKGTAWGSEEMTKAIDDLKVEISKFKGKSSTGSQKPITIQSIQNPERVSSRDSLVSAISNVARMAIPAVVQINVTERREVPNPFLPFEGSPLWRNYFNLPKKMPKKFKEKLMGIGTGIIIDAKGHILTNNHVVGGASEIKVLMSNGEEYPAELVGTDPKTDLGVIKISADKSFPFLKFGDSDAVEVGQWVIAIGQPRGLEQSVTQGIISAKHRTGITDPSSYQDFLQTDAAINPGNSGGPLLTLDGLVIGVNSAIATQSGGFEGIGFAIPSKMAVHITNELITQGKVERGWMGVSIQEITPDLAKKLGLPNPEGALIADIMTGGPADEAGLKKGDIILEYDGKKIDNASSLRNMVANTTIGKEVKIVIRRNMTINEFTLKIGNLEELVTKLTAIVKKRLGVEVEPVTTQEADKYGMTSPNGVSIRWIDPKGPLGQAGFEKGDLILMIGQQPVKSVESFVNLVNSIPPNQKIVVLALDHRTGNTGYVQVEIK